MGRIAVTLSGLERTLLNRLAEADASVALHTLRLATNERINAPRDNPTRFVELSSHRARLTAVRATMDNVASASSLVSQTQLVLDQIRAQLDTIRELALEDENQALTSNERAANQADIDAALVEIDRLVGTEIDGRRVLDGSADFVYQGVNAAQIDGLHAASLGSLSTHEIDGEVTTAAARGEKVHDAGGATIAANATFVLTGERGAVTISVNSGETLAVAAERINQESHRTGVTATVAGTTIELESLSYGSRGTVALNVTSGSFATTGTGAGTNGVATINGQSVTGDGNTFFRNENGFRYTLEIHAGFTGPLDEVTVTGTALTFALSTEVDRRSQLSIGGLQTARLGGVSGALADLATGGAYAGLNTNAPRAVRIVDEALARLTLVEGEVDGFANAAIASAEEIHAGFESATEDAIDDINAIDEEEEEVLLARAEGLASNARAALAILVDQRSGVLELVRKIAGLD